MGFTQFRKYPETCNSFQEYHLTGLATDFFHLQLIETILEIGLVDCIARMHYQ